MKGALSSQALTEGQKIEAVHIALAQPCPACGAPTGQACGSLLDGHPPSPRVWLDVPHARRFTLSKVGAVR
jgi:hypothetical protein